METLLTQILIGVLTILFGVVAFFFRRLIAQIDRVTGSYDDFAKKINGISVDVSSFTGKISAIEREMAALPTITSAVASLTRQFELSKKDLEMALVAARQIKEIQETVAVLKRNEATIFSRIDELYKGLDNAGSIISEFRSKVINLK